MTQFHLRQARDLMKELITQLREGMRKVQDPRAQAMLETSAEVVRGLIKAFDDGDPSTIEIFCFSDSPARSCFS